MSSRKQSNTKIVTQSNTFLDERKSEYLPLRISKTAADSYRSLTERERKLLKDGIEIFIVKGSTQIQQQQIAMNISMTVQNIEQHAQQDIDLSQKLQNWYALFSPVFDIAIAKYPSARKEFERIMRTVHEN